MAMASSFKPTASSRKKGGIVDHITECSFCREEFMLLFRLQGYDFIPKKLAGKMEHEDSPTKNASAGNFGFPSFWRYAYILFGLGLIISAIFLFIQQKELSEVQRARKTNILLLYPTSTHTFPNTLIFRWQEQSASQYYLLELFDEALSPIWTSHQIHDTQVQLPANIYSNLHFGKSYFWMITAFSDKSKIEESKLVRFLVLNRE